MYRNEVFSEYILPKYVYNQLLLFDSFSGLNDTDGSVTSSRLSALNPLLSYVIFQRRCVKIDLANETKCIENKQVSTIPA